MTFRVICVNENKCDICFLKIDILILEKCLKETAMQWSSGRISACGTNRWNSNPLQQETFFKYWLSLRGHLF